MRHFNRRQWLTLAVIFAWAVLWAILLAMLAYPQAQAREDRWGHWVYRTRCDDYYGYCHRVPVWRRIRDYRHRYYPSYPRYRNSYNEDWRYRDEHEEHGEDCKGDAIFVVGELHNTEDGALNAAIRQWQSQARYLHGERFMSLENARHYRYRCDRASTNETTVGKIVEGVGHLTGTDGYQKRCALSAVPCRLGMERGDRDRR